MENEFDLSETEEFEDIPGRPSFPMIDSNTGPTPRAESRPDSRIRLGASARGISPSGRRGAAGSLGTGRSRKKPRGNGSRRDERSSGRIRRRLKRAALIVAASQSDHRSASRIGETFLEMDSTADGTLGIDELRAALPPQPHRRRVSLAAEHETLFASLDHDGSGAVHYHEFLAATLEGEGILDREVLRDTFDRMDHDDSGVISPANIRSLLGTRASDDLVDRLIADGDSKKNGVIDFDEFLAAMTTPPPSPADARAPRQLTRRPPPRGSAPRFHAI